MGLYTRCSCRYCRRNRAQHVILNADMILVCFFTTPSLQYRLLFQLPTRNKSLSSKNMFFFAYLLIRKCSVYLMFFARCVHVVCYGRVRTWTYVKIRIEQVRWCISCIHMLIFLSFCNASQCELHSFFYCTFLE